MNDQISTLKEHRQLPTRLISVFLAMCYAFIFVMPSGAFSATSSFKRSTKKKANVSRIPNTEQIRVPEDYGRKKESFSGGRDRLIIHIQDAHANFEAQTNIAQIIDHLATELELDLIAVEGSEGIIDTSLFASFPDEEIKREVATYFMKKGKITGPEFLSITSNHPLTLFGIENKDLYLENLETFLNSLEYRFETVAYVADIEDRLNRIKEGMFTGELKSFDAAEEAYAKEEMTLTDYVIFLAKQGGLRNISVKEYPNMRLLHEAIELEQDIDFDSVEKERTMLIDLLGEKLKKDELSDLLVKSLNFKLKTISSSEYYHHLELLAIKAKYDWSSAPNLNAYIRYINLSDRVDSEALFDELNGMASAVKKHLFPTDAHRRLDLLTKDIRILKSFFELKLSLDEVGYYRANRSHFPIKNFTSFILAHGSKYEISLPKTRQDLVDNNLTELEHFYTVAQQRDKVLVDNMLSYMTANDEKLAVMITGGFHTEGVTDLLKGDQISYVVIAPKITDLNAETPYLDVMTGKKTPFEELVSGDDEEELR